MTDIAEGVQEVVADAAEFVGEQAIDMAGVVRSMTRVKVQFGLLGVAVGAAASAVATYYITVRRLEEKYIEIAEAEVADAKAHYEAKVVTLRDKPTLDDLGAIVKERGYSSTAPSSAPSVSPPLAVSPPAAMVEDAKGGDKLDDVVVDDDGDVLNHDDVEVVDVPEPGSHNVFRDGDPTAPVEGGWDYAKELRRRTTGRPYVIHVDEKDEFDHYQDTSLVYYEADDTLCNEREEIMDVAERERLIGERNLGRFGAGTNGDDSVVFIRNDMLEMHFEIQKSPNSYAEEVQGISDGLSHSEYTRHERRPKMRFDDDDHPTR